jgi:acyl-CoA synthetase (AMP-forming)/AMP-acid ligase II
MISRRVPPASPLGTAVLADNNDLFLEAFFGVPCPGGIILPVNIRLSPGEVAYILDDCRPRTCAGGRGASAASLFLR